MLSHRKELKNIFFLIQSGLVYGHTGHVRFLTCVELHNSGTSQKSESSIAKDTHTSEGITLHDLHRRSSMAATMATMATRMLVISGGDGYEDFRNNTTNEAAGRDDSTNHLLLWQVWCRQHHMTLEVHDLSYLTFDQF